MNIRSLLIYAGCGVLFTACAVPPGPMCISRNRSYGNVPGTFRARWDDYYLRALSYMEGGCYRAALADFRTALGRKDGDRRMVRTYGLRYIDYFPHRERGVALFLSGDLPAAKAALERSLETEPSQKARFYLDQIRRLRFLESGAAPSIPELAVTVTGGVPAGTRRYRVRGDPVRLSGSARDRQYVREIRVSGKPLYIQETVRQLDFSSSFRLPPGKHRVEVRAENLVGGVARRTLTLFVDRTGPVIAVDAVANGEVTGRLTDPAGIAAFQINGRPVAVSSGRTVFFSVPLAGRKRKPAAGIRLYAADRLGNQTAVRIPRPDRLHALRISEGRPLLRADVKGGSLLPRAGEKAPHIRLPHWMEGVFYRKTVFPDIVVTSAVGIATVRINEERTAGAGAKILCFGPAVELDEGENHLRVESVDVFGRRAVRRVRLTRKIPAAYQVRRRLRVAFRPFEEVLTPGDQKAGALQKRLKTGLAREFTARKRFYLLASEPPNRREKSPLPAESVLLGNLRVSGTGVEASIRLADVKTGRIFSLVDAFARESTPADYRRIVARLAEILHRDFPLAGGVVVSRNRRRMRADLEWKRAEVGWPLIVYRYVENDPVRFSRRGSETRIMGDARIDRLEENTCGARLEHLDRPIAVGDRIVTR